MRPRSTSERCSYTLLAFMLRVSKLSAYTKLCGWHKGINFIMKLECLKRQLKHGLRPALVVAEERAIDANETSISLVQAASQNVI